MDEKDFEHRMTEVEQRSRSNSKRIGKLENVLDTLTELVASVATIAQKQSDMNDDMKEMKVEVKNLAAKPGKRWDSIVEKALLTIVAAIVGYIMIKLGIG